MVPLPAPEKTYAIRCHSSFPLFTILCPHNLNHGLIRPGCGCNAHIFGVVAGVCNLSFTNHISPEIVHKPHFPSNQFHQK